MEHIDTFDILLGLLVFVAFMVLVFVLWDLIIRQFVRKLIPLYDVHCNCWEVRNYVYSYDTRIRRHSWSPRIYPSLEQVRARFPKLTIYASSGGMVEPVHGAYYYNDQTSSFLGYYGVKRIHEDLKKQGVVSQ